MPQSTIKKVKNKEASDKILSLRDRLNNFVDAMETNPDAVELLDLKAIKDLAGHLLTASYKLYNK